ncbi:hypothetical protein LWI29_001331 [Acer saccharum]|uniref:Replication protein A subunit n=1 Tax=Acer saccharum TaxID=4024 RepID=A0AA39S3B4_ACESA|nr:hypothetical protein LWI29_001331 [Acer saccharum]
MFPSPRVFKNFPLTFEFRLIQTPVFPFPAMELTENTIALICNGDVTSDNDLIPVVQVLELKSVVSKQQQQQQQQQRFRMVLSDGSLSQQGMLATQRNELVTSGLLQIGSVIRLTKYTCNVIQKRMIVIVMDLEVLIEKCDPIGKPIPAQRPSATPQPSVDRPATTLTSNAQSFVVGSVDRPATLTSNAQSFANVSVDQPLQQHYSRMNQLPGSTSYVAAGAPSNCSKPEFVVGSGSFNEPNTVSHNPRTQVCQPQMGSFGGRTPPMYSNRGPAVARNETLPRIIPIAALSPYTGMWSIKARVTSKGELKHYNNNRGEGKVFHFDLLDCDGGEIRVTCFNAMADKFYDRIEARKVYLISKGSLKPAAKTFNHLHNDYEIYPDNTTMIQQCLDDDNSIPQQQFHFRPIIDIEGMENNSIVDIIGVVSFISPAASIMRKKDNIETQKRTLHLKDMSGRSVELTLWGSLCNLDGQRLQNMCDAGVFPVLAVKSGRVSDFNGKTMGTITTSQLFIEPDFPEAQRLKEWYDKEGKNSQSVSISRETSNVGGTDIRKTISAIKDEGLGTKGKPDWIAVSATVIYIKFDNFCYTACPIMIGDRPCYKKASNNGDGRWHCDRCNQSVDECDYRYSLQFQIQDHTGLTWVTAFQEVGEKIMGVSAKDLYHLKYVDQNDEKFTDIICNATFTKYLFKLKVNEETFNDEQRVKATVVKAERYDHLSDTRFLLDFMDRLKVGDSSYSTLKAESILLNPGIVDSRTGNTGSRTTAAADANYVRSNSNASGEFGSLANQVGPYGNQYRGSRLPAADTEGVQQYCNSCGAAGHQSINCPSIMNAPGQSVGGGYANRVSPGMGSGASGECYKCNKPGHWARECPGLDAAPAYGSTEQSVGGGYANRVSPGTSFGASGECYKCNKPGHWARDCPGLDAAPAYGSTGQSVGGGYANRVSPGAGVSASGECYKCHKPGHWARDCPGLDAAPAYGSSGVGIFSGRYGGTPRQQVGGS